MYKNLKKPLFVTFPDKTVQAFDIKEDLMMDLNNTWHLHNEFELRFIQHGTCKLLVGSAVVEIKDREIVLLGSELPHCWSTWHASTEQPREVESLALHFHPDCLGKQFLLMPEAYNLIALLKNAQQGIVFKGNSCADVGIRMQHLLKARGVDRLILFIDILNQLAGWPAQEKVCNDLPHCSEDNLKSRKRIKLIRDYTLRNYKQRITITQVANLSELSVTAFCKYFKTTTNRSYYDFLTEIRVTKACQMLASRNQKIANIAIDCGFLNISNFYRHFNNYMQMSPCEYRRLHSPINLVA